MTDDTFDRLTILERVDTNVARAKFWGKVRYCIHGQTCPYCCWEWCGRYARKGYGEFYYKKQGVVLMRMRAHRMAWELWHRRMIPEDLWCLHHCDNPPCCNPHHLFLGSHQDNVDDKQRKGRTSKGAKHGAAMRRGTLRHGEAFSFTKLTEMQVRAIRHRAHGGAMTKAELAREYGVHWCTIRDIITRRTWHHIA